MITNSAIYPRSRSLPKIVGEDGQARPNSCPHRSLRQHSTQTKLAFEHADRRLYAATKPLQLPKPFGLLMRLLLAAQATQFRNADFVKTGLAKLKHVIGTVVAPIRGEFLGLYPETGFACRSTESSSVLSLGLPR